MDPLAAADLLCNLPYFLPKFRLAEDDFREDTTLCAVNGVAFER